MRIMAIDPSLSRSGVWVETESEEGSCVIVTDPSESHIDRLELILRRSQALLASLYDVVVIEQYSFGSKGNAVTKMAEVGGIFRAVARHHGHFVVELSTATWRSAIMGRSMTRASKKTRADRNRYLGVVYRLFDGRLFHTTDEADAFMMAQYVKRVAREEIDNQRLFELLLDHGLCQRKGILFQGS